MYPSEYDGVMQILTFRKTFRPKVSKAKANAGGRGNSSATRSRKADGERERKAMKGEEGGNEFSAFFVSYKTR